ncbi:MAG: hypothetical protein U1E65_27255 [Myxococcota bacterium]
MLRISHFGLPTLALFALLAGCDESPLGLVPDTGAGHHDGSIAVALDLGVVEPDAGPTVPDAGQPEPDAGAPIPDAAPAEDAAPEVDAGETPDTGASADAGTAPDAEAQLDAESAPDAGVEVDAGASPDAGFAVDSGPADTGVPPVNLALYALEPAVAGTGETLELEGDFDAAAMAVFPGGATATVASFGDHRATVRVPSGATEGGVFVQSGARTSNALPFRRPSFHLGLRTMGRHLEQASYARAMPSFVTPRRGATAVVIGPWIYVFGGHDGGQPVTRTERALINADGSIGSFVEVLGSELLVGRSGATVAPLGRYLYVIGGRTAAGITASVERAPLAPSGYIGSFVAMPAASLTVARARFGLAVVGNHLVAIGGETPSGATASVESALIHPDGSLDAFAPAPSGLSTPRAGAGYALSQGRLYAIGGETPSGLEASAESAALAPDGSIGAFTAEANALPSPRSDAAAIAVGNTLYLVGGFGSSGALAEILAADLSPGLGAFRQAPALFTARGAAAAAIGANDLWVLGGATTPSGAPLGGQEHGSLESGRGPGVPATSLAALATGRSHFTLMVCGDHLYAIGGYIASTIVGSIEIATVGASGTLGNFSAVQSQLAVPRMGARAVVVDDQLYLVGGRGAQGSLASVEVATIAPDCSLGAFNLVPGVNLNQSRSGYGAAVIGRELFIFGGYPDGTDFLATVERASFSPTGVIQSFTTDASRLSTARDGFGSAIIGETLTISGGRAGIIIDILGAIATAEQASIGPGGGISSFTAAPSLSLPVPRSEPAAFTSGGRLYVVGGFGGNPPRYVTELDGIDLMSPSPSFQALSPMPNGRAREAAIVVKDFAYMLGGDVSRGAATSIAAARLE